MKTYFVLLLAALLATQASLAQMVSGKAASDPGDLPLEVIKLPEGFKIEVYAAGMPNARSMTRSDSGIIYVGTRGDKDGRVYAVVDEDKDNKADKIYQVAAGLNTPNGVTWHKGALYIAERSRISKIENVDQHLETPAATVTVLDNIPTDGGHDWKYLNIGPDEMLYFAMGAPCNICNREDDEPRYSTIQRMNLDGSGWETYAHGVRASIGYTWRPGTNELWFTDNNRDLLGDDRPPCELNKATEKGQHFGYPFCHAGDDPDPEFGELRKCEEFVKPVQKLDAHIAPLGLRFYTGTTFPAQYHNQLFIAEHGSWNRSIPLGYRVTLVEVDAEGNATSYKTFAEGWLQRAKSWGRPVDIHIQPDGSMLVSDDQAGVLYRISYAG